jgi:LmbE family N-acetylglucosaminyl deacetylase
VIHPIEDVLRRFQPQVVYTHHRGDANTDHQIVFRASYAACRPMGSLARSVQRLLCYEVPSSTEQAPAFPEYAFLPNVYIDIESTWKRKLEALSCYATEMPGWPHPRSVEYIDALGVKRGGEAGFRRAEAFALVRETLGVRPPIPSGEARR